MLKTCQQRSEIKLQKAAFDKFDTDGSGQIDALELRELMKEFGQKKTKFQIAQMVKEVDDDGDGVISFSEFQVMLTKNDTIEVGNHEEHHHKGHHQLLVADL